MRCSQKGFTNEIKFVNNKEKISTMFFCNKEKLTVILVAYVEKRMTVKEDLMFLMPCMIKSKRQRISN